LAKNVKELVAMIIPTKTAKPIIKQFSGRIICM
jgi:hypothetical protein